jgi:hypothetical protein
MGTLRAIILNWVCFAVLAAGSAALAAACVFLHRWVEAADAAAVTAISVWFSIRFYRAKHA